LKLKSFLTTLGEGTVFQTLPAEFIH